VRDSRELLGSEAIRLFEDRTVKVQPSFAITPDIAPVVAELCRRLDGLPLAIELAAARVRALTVRHIAAAMDDRFRLLVARSRASSMRMQTLRATLDWSYELLTLDEQAVDVLGQLFAGGGVLRWRAGWHRPP
jgi:predicted ATPase